MHTILPPYAELHCISNFTFLRGASHPEELVMRAASLGYTSLAITDEASLAGVVRAHVEAKRHSLHLIIGSEIRLQCGLKMVVLAMDRDGYGNLSEWITLGRCRAPKGQYDLRREDIDEPGHLQNLPGCIALFLPERGTEPDKLKEQGLWIAGHFPQRAWITLELLLRLDDDVWREQLQALSQETGLPPTAAGDVLMHVRSRKPLQDTLSAIRLGKAIAECGLALQPNAASPCSRTPNSTCASACDLRKSIGQSF